MAGLWELIYIQNEDIHTISYSKFCTELSYAAPTWVNAVLAENVEQAVNLIRENVKKYISDEMKEKAYVKRFEDFTFKICFNNVEANGFSLHHWDSDRKTHSLF